MKVRLTSAARADVSEAHNWYLQRSPRAARAFLDAVEVALTAIGESPAANLLVHRNLRRLLVRGFPYGVFYYVQPDQVVVIGCMHGARHPRTWQRRSLN